MDAITMLKERRSVRKFKDDKVVREILNDAISTALYAPSWANFQTVRYTVIDDDKLLKTLADDGLKGFAPNVKTLKRAAGAVVVSNVKGKSGCSPQGDYVTSKGDAWEMFDAGIACQTFCLAAYEKGIGTVIMGIFDEDKVAELVDLPEDESVAAIIPYGYEADHPNTPTRKALEEVVRYL